MTSKPKTDSTGTTSENAQAKGELDLVDDPPTHRIILDGLAKHLIRAGVINPRGRTKEQLRSDAARMFVGSGQRELKLTTDYSDTILNWADACVGTKDYGVAVLLYFTWAEHVLNDIVATYCMRRGLEEEQWAQVIRDVKFEAKVTWLLELLRAPKIDEEHLKVIRQLKSVRDIFVHYKWRGTSGDESDETMTNLLARFTSTRRYLQRYRDKKLTKNYDSLEG